MYLYQVPHRQREPRAELEVLHATETVVVAVVIADVTTVDVAEVFVNTLQLFPFVIQPVTELGE
jgi:hypothetical protein